MNTLSQILLQLHEADKYASAKNPHLRRLAVVLLDNIVEVQLRRKAEMEFMFDKTDLRSGVRKHDLRHRRAVVRWHGELVDLAVRLGWMTEDDGTLVSYAHRVRNNFYHEGGYDDLDGEIAIRLLYTFVKTHFPKWRTARPMLLISAELPVDFTTAQDDASGSAPLLTTTDGSLVPSNVLRSEDHWQQMLDDVFKYRGVDETTELIRAKIVTIIDKIEQSIEFIRHGGEGIDFNHVLLHRFSMLTPVFENEIIGGRRMLDAIVALNIYLAILPDEDRLFDIEDPAARAIEYHSILDRHTFRPHLISPQRLTEYRQNAAEVVHEKEAQAIHKFLAIERELVDVSRAVHELASDLDGYIQLECDHARGK